MRGMPGSALPLLREWAQAVAHTPQIFRRIAFRKRTLEEELQEALLRGSLRKAFGGFDLLMLGLGIVIGSGWAQLSGYTAQQYAGPAVIVSYVFSGVAALLAACCFAELCAEFPVSGGAFSYVMATFGELPAFVTLGGLILEYAVGMAAVARGFSKYLARLCNADPTLFVIEVGGTPPTHEFDIMAAGVVLLMSALLSLGVRESALVISSVTTFKLVLLVFISVVGYVRGTWDNAAPFIDPNFGADGIFLGAALVFFAYVGFDAVANAAEESRNVAHLPWALVGTPAIALCMYVMLAFALVMITEPSPLAATAPYGPYAGVSFPDLTVCDPNLSFTTAFVNIQGMKWMQYVIAITALMGILTALTVGLFSISRIVMAASRDWLLPPFLARVSPRTQTPLVAQMTFGVIIALVALFVEVNYATALVSFGTLVALWVGCNAHMWRRYSPGVQMRVTRYGTVEASVSHTARNWVPALGARLPEGGRRALAAACMLVINALSIGFAVYYAVATDDVSYMPPQEDIAAANCSFPSSAPLAQNPSIYLQAEWGHQGLGPLWWAVGWVGATALMQVLCPLEYEPQGWHVPHYLMPWVPSAAIALTIFSVGALPNSEYWKIGTFFGVLLAVYLLYALPMSYIKHSRVDSAGGDGLKVVELAYAEGLGWQPAAKLALYSGSSQGALALAPSAGISSLAYSASAARRAREFKEGRQGERGLVDSATATPAGSGQLRRSSTGGGSTANGEGSVQSRQGLPPVDEG